MYNKEYHKEYYLKNKDKIDKRTLEYYYANKEGQVERRRKYIKDKMKDDIAYRLYRYAKKRAKEANIDISIKLEDVRDIMVDCCPILGIPLTSTYGSGRSTRASSNYSLDRIDSSKGYHKDNIQILSYLANIMKNNASIQEQILFAKGILKFYGEDTRL